MKVIMAPLGPLGLLAIVYLCLLFSNFSRRLGAVTKMKDHYRWFRLASGLIAVAATSQIIRGTAALAKEAPAFLCTSVFALLSFYIPLAVGVTLALVLVWYYWGWILKERIE
jgi:ribose/xylose/arabinose/galactoside ABC-type transport system permease subunit